MTTTNEPLVTAASVDEVIRAIESVDLESDWEEVAPRLRLALPRRRALPVDVEDLPQRRFEPGLDTVLGLDIGPAMLFVTHEQVDGWGVTAGEAFDRALANAHSKMAERKQFALVHERIADVPTLAFQSRQGWASTLLLLPDQLTRVFGERSGLILAPMRDLVICLPLDVERELARWLLDEFAAVDMNALDLPPMALVDGQLTHDTGLARAVEPATRVN